MAVLDLGRAGGMDRDTWWLNVYTMLSRPKALDRSFYVNFPTRSELFDAGPPQDLRRLIEQQKEQAVRTMERVQRRMSERSLAWST